MTRENLAASLARIEAMPTVDIVVIRGGLELPNGSRPIAGTACTVDGILAARLLRSGAADLAPPAAVGASC